MRPTAAALTDLHRRAQAHLSARTVAAMAAVWPLLNPRDLDATAPAWLATSARTVERHRLASAGLAGAYLSELRRTELGSSIEAFGLSPIPPMSTAAVATSLLVTGPIAFKARIAAAMPWEQATELTFAGSAAAASRHALSGGRSLILATGHSDPKITSIVRVTAAGACKFCLRIAEYSRTNPALLHEFKCHDGCHCQPRPIYG
jgi:hypothetical protein